MLKLFNDVLCVGFFPEIWNKNRDKLDPNNYRGICVNSNLGKVLCSVLNTRLLHFLMKHNALSKCQIGFLLKCHTSDHIFTLQTLIDKLLQFKPHPLQHLHQPIGQHIRTRPHSRSHSTRHRDKVSSLRRWPGPPVAHWRGGASGQPESAGGFLSVLGPDGQPPKN